MVSGVTIGVLTSGTVSVRFGPLANGGASGRCRLVSHSQQTQHDAEKE